MDFFVAMATLDVGRAVADPTGKKYKKQGKHIYCSYEGRKWSKVKEIEMVDGMWTQIELDDEDVRCALSNEVWNLLHDGNFNLLSIGQLTQIRDAIQKT